MTSFDSFSLVELACLVIYENKNLFIWPSDIANEHFVFFSENAVIFCNPVAARYVKIMYGTITCDRGIENYVMCRMYGTFEGWI